MDRDGLNDLLNFQITIPLQENESIVGVTLLLFFDYKLHVCSGSNFALDFCSGSNFAFVF